MDSGLIEMTHRHEAVAIVSGMITYLGYIISVPRPAAPTNTDAFLVSPKRGLISISVEAGMLLLLNEQMLIASGTSLQGSVFAVNHWALPGVCNVCSGVVDSYNQ